MPYADRTMPWYEPAAATAMRKCEERLRLLHPYAMARYDRLRGEGMGPADAMREAAPLFGQPSHARDGEYTDRLVLDAGNDENLTWTATAPQPGPAGSGGLAPATSRNSAAGRSSRRCRHVPGPKAGTPLGEAEQRTVLETLTNLPDEVIDRIVQPTSPAPAQLHVARPARPWEHDFPVPIQETVASAAADGQAPAQPAAARPAAARQPSRHPHPRP